MLKLVATGITAVLLATFSSHAAFVGFEAESGTLGSGWAVSNSPSPAYITITTSITGTGANNPTNAARVATYTVTFPSAGTYQLYAHVYVGPGGANSDSFFFGNGFGVKDPTVDANWVLVNGLSGAGFNNSSDVVTTGGSLGNGIWKWVNLGLPTFTVTAGNMTQTFQIGGRESGLNLDKFVFGTANYSFTVANLDNGTDGTPPFSVPAPTSPLSVTNAAGTSLIVGSNGVYTVNFSSPAWTFTGYLAQSLTNRTVNSGTDNIGGYAEINFNYTNSVAHVGGIRLYTNLPVALFIDTTLATSANDLAFPRWYNYPAVPSHLSFGNTFSPYNFSTLFDDNLWVFFDTNHDNFMISAATNFMVSSTVMKSDS